MELDEVLRRARALRFAERRERKKLRQEVFAQSEIFKAAFVVDGEVAEARQDRAAEEAGAFAGGRRFGGAGIHFYVLDAGGGGAAFQDETVDGVEAVQEGRGEALHLLGDVQAGCGLYEATPAAGLHNPDRLARYAEADFYFRADRDKSYVRL